MLVIGEKEAAVQSVSVRHSKRGDIGVQTLAEFLAGAQSEISERRQ
jgi:threonyl-tRNA synthetase